MGLDLGSVSGGRLFVPPLTGLDFLRQDEVPDPPLSESEAGLKRRIQSCTQPCADGNVCLNGAEAPV